MHLACFHCCKDPSYYDFYFLVTRALSFFSLLHVKFQRLRIYVFTINLCNIIQRFLTIVCFSLSNKYPVDFLAFDNWKDNNILDFFNSCFYFGFRSVIWEFCVEGTRANNSFILRWYVWELSKDIRRDEITGRNYSIFHLASCEKWCFQPLIEKARHRRWGAYSLG